MRVLLMMITSMDPLSKNTPQIFERQSSCIHGIAGILNTTFIIIHSTMIHSVTESFVEI